mmetsp:Transcript_10895/g.26191  ORF Transcript_10895/g.26191 Transcript_10895/m.26191 type:complete len:248 (-) Transcript_10895:315-1058(-)|eukprot:CAMPEP_0197175368 /NCGR_PEP_ID=MMETSP1423-20130617/1599_1 /TAXON_ID=476441 /ORGANISM="Pseudo-nitzschia heimii, Strain UNC1101" /LENGTH=247 /DNA_ID=CAMNT_0042624505 /DNA_START=165 /DNA_END=908 /DNA_ORIENTATION=+
MARSSYLSLTVFFVFAQLASLAEAQEMIEVFRWVIPYDGPQEFTANVGDTMVFRWTQSIHNVYIHPTMDCTLDGRIEVGTQPGTEYTFVEADGSPEGTDMFFACDIGSGAHCRAGQFLTVKVFSLEDEDAGMVDGDSEIDNSDPVEEDSTMMVETEMPVIVNQEPDEEETDVSEAPVATPEEEADGSEAPVAAPDDAAGEPEDEPAAAEEPATEADSAESSESSANTRLCSFATVAGLFLASLALVL